MILEEFAKYLHKHNDEIANSTTSTTKLLCEWIRHVIHKNPKEHADKIVHKEIMLAENGEGEFLIVGKSESGRVLVNALYNFALSYEHHVMSKWLADKKPVDFISE